MDSATKASVDRRLARLERQVRGLRKTVAEDVYCVDILTQVAERKMHDSARTSKIVPAVRVANTIGLAVDESGKIQAYGFQPGGMNTFEPVVKDDRFRIKTDPRTPDTILPSRSSPQVQTLR